MKIQSVKQYVQYTSLQAGTCPEYLRKDIQEAGVISGWKSLDDWETEIEEDLIFTIGVFGIFNN